MSYSRAYSSMARAAARHAPGGDIMGGNTRMLNLATEFGATRTTTPDARGLTRVDFQLASVE